MRTIFFALTILLLLVDPAQAQFGKNKVQYKDFEWSIIKSKHFDIYFYQGGEYLAKYTALAAEKSLSSISRRLNYSIPRRISMMIYQSHNDFQQTNVISDFMPEGVGGVTELYKNRIALPFEGNYQQFEHVIHHELVHAVINEMFYGGNLQTAVTNNIRVVLPLWMNEGFAEFEAADGYDTKTDMFMRDIALSEYLRGLNSLNGYFAYRGGQAFYWFIAEKYGERKVGELLNRMRTAATLDAGFKAAFNMSLEDFSELWVKELKKKYLPDVEKYEAVEDFATRVTNHVKENSFYNSSPAVSPDGERLAFISNRDQHFGIFIMELNDRKKVRQVLSSGRTLDFEELNILTPGISWDPTGKKLAVSAKAGGEDALFIYDLDRDDYQKHLLGMSMISSASWSPDGQYIAFVATKSEQSDLYVFNTSTKSVEKVTDDVFTDLHPTWSPDSKTIFFVSDRGDYTNGDYRSGTFKMWDYNHDVSDVYSVGIQTRDIKRLTFTPEFDKTSLAVSPDGDKLLYVSDENGIGNLFVRQIDGDKEYPITNSLSAITQLSLSRDGTRMFFTSQNRGGYDIFELKFPLQRKAIDSLIPTKYRQSLIEKQRLAQKIEAGSTSTPLFSEKATLKGYGTFDLELSRQQLVVPNVDALKLRDNAGKAGALGAVQGPLTDASLTPSTPYTLSFSTDLIFSQVGYNTFWGAQGQTYMMFSDMLGDHQIMFAGNFNFDLANSNFMLAYSYLPEVIDYQVLASHMIGFTINPLSGEQFTFRNLTGGINASYPFDRFRRVEYGVDYSSVNRTSFDPASRTPPLTRNFLVTHARFVYDGTDEGWWGPASGMRANFAVRGVPKFTEQGIGFVSLGTDIRQYVSFFDGFTTLAVRGAAGKAFSTKANQNFFFIGGMQNWINPQLGSANWPFIEPEDFAFLQDISPLRGFGVSEALGSNFFLSNVELRFPLFYGLLAGPVPIPLQGVQGTMFMDVGSAWTGNFVATRRDDEGRLQRQDLLMSTGIGMRTLFLGLPLRIDMAWTNEFYGWSRPRWIFSLGGDW